MQRFSFMAMVLVWVPALARAEASNPPIPRHVLALGDNKKSSETDDALACIALRNEDLVEMRDAAKASARNVEKLLQADSEGKLSTFLKGLGPVVQDYVKNKDQGKLAAYFVMSPLLTRKMLGAMAPLGSFDIKTVSFNFAGNMDATFENLKCTYSLLRHEANKQLETEKDIPAFTKNLATELRRSLELVRSSKGDINKDQLGQILRLQAQYYALSEAGHASAELDNLLKGNDETPGLKTALMTSLGFDAASPLQSLIDQSMATLASR